MTLATLPGSVAGLASAVRPQGEQGSPCWRQYA